MLVCEHCEHALGLNIEHSGTYTNDEGEVTAYGEEIVCVRCGCEGTAYFDLESNIVNVSGGLTHVDERPLTVTSHRHRGQADV